VGNRDQIIIEHFEKRQELTDKVKGDTDKILGAINLEKLLDDPKDYLTILGTVFMEMHQKELLEAFDLGQKFGKDML
jgi:hypothetical protein